MTPPQTDPAISIKVVFLTLLAAAAYAQTATGVVEGRVVDPAGAVLPGAAVRAKEASTGTARSTRTNSHCFYQFSYLTLGQDDLTVEAARFHPPTARANLH